MTARATAGLAVGSGWTTRSTETGSVGTWASGDGAAAVGSFGGSSSIVEREGDAADDHGGGDAGGGGEAAPVPEGAAEGAALLEGASPDAVHASEGLGGFIELVVDVVPDAVGVELTFVGPEGFEAIDGFGFDLGLVAFGVEERFDLLVGGGRDDVGVAGGEESEVSGFVGGGLGVLQA